MAKNGRILIILCLSCTLLFFIMYMTNNKRIAESSNSGEVVVEQTRSFVAQPERKRNSSKYFLRNIGNWEDAPYVLATKTR